MATFPRGVVLMAAPSQVHSLGAGVSLNCPVLSSDYPASCLTDGKTDRPMRAAWETMSVTLDLGGVFTPNLLGLLGHNIDHGRVIGVTNEAGLARGFGGRDPNCWIDLRGFPTSARYWTIFVNNNSVPVSMCEVVIATATVFQHGLWVGGLTEKLSYPGYRDLTEYLKTYISMSGALVRSTDTSVQVDEADRLKLAAISDEVLVSGGRVLVVPNSLINDIWFCEWPVLEEATYENQVLRTQGLPLYEPPSALLRQGIMAFWPPELILPTAPLTLQVTEAITVAESFSSLGQTARLTRQAAELITVAESRSAVVGTVPLTRQAAELITVAESRSAVVGTVVLTVQPVETLGVLDAVSRASSLPLTRVQATGKVLADNTTTVALTFATPPTIGNGVVVAVTMAGVIGTTAPTCADNRGNVYTLAVFQHSSSFLPQVAILVCPAITASAGPFTITLTRSALAYFTVSAIEVSGVGSGLVVEQTVSATAVSAAAATGLTAALTSANALLVAVSAFAGTENPITVEVVSPTWTQEHEETSSAHGVGEADSRVVTGAAGTTPSCSWTVPVSRAWTAALAAFAAGTMGRVNFVQSGYDASGGTTYASPAMAITAGNTIVACFGADGTGWSITGVTDTAGNTYTKVVNSAFDYRQEIWVAANAIGHATNVVTAAFSTSVMYRAACVMQYAGVVAASPVDAADYTTGPTTGAQTTGTLTGTTPESIHVLMSRWGFGDSTYPAGFTKFTSAGPGGPEVADKVVTGGAFSGTYTMPVGHYYVLAVILKGA